MILIKYHYLWLSFDAFEIARTQFYDFGFPDIKRKASNYPLRAIVCKPLTAARRSLTTVSEHTLQHKKNTKGALHMNQRIHL